MGGEARGELPRVLDLVGCTCVPRGMCSLWAARALGSLEQNRHGGGEVCATGGWP